MNLQKYFFVILFLSSIESNQKLFCAEQNFSRSNSLPNFLTKSIEVVIGNSAIDEKIDIAKCIQVMTLHEDLYQKYSKLFPGLSRIDFHEVFNSFLDQKKQSAMLEAIKQDIDFITSEFGRAVQEAVKSKKDKEFVAQPLSDDISDVAVMELYERYQQKIGSFDRDLFLRAVNDIKALNRVDLFVDACEHDISEIKSEFGMQVKQRVVISRHEVILQQLWLKFKDNPNVAPVCQKILARIHQTKEFENPLFFSKFILLSFEDCFEDLNNPVFSIDYKENMIIKYSNMVLAIFREFKPKEIEDCVACDSYVDAFISAFGEYKKTKAIVHGNVRIIAQTLKRLHQKGSQHRNMQLESKFISSKKTASKDSLSSVQVQEPVKTFDVAKELERCVQSEMNRRIPIVNDQALVFSKLETDKITSFEQVQQQEQKTLIDQESTASVQLHHDERYGFVNTFLTFLEGFRNVVATRLDKRKMNVYAYASLMTEAQEFSNKLELESENLLEELNKNFYDAALSLEAVQLENQKEFACKQAARIETFIKRADASLLTIRENAHKNFLNLYVGFLQKYRKIYVQDMQKEPHVELKNLLKKLLTQKVDELRLAQYSFCSTTNPLEIYMYNVLMEMNSQKKSEPLPIFVDRCGFEWRLSSLPDGSRVCSHDLLGIMGKIDSTGRAFFDEKKTGRWLALN